MQLRIGPPTSTQKSNTHRSWVFYFWRRLGSEPAPALAAMDPRIHGSRIRTCQTFGMNYLILTPLMDDEERLHHGSPMAHRWMNNNFASRLVACLSAITSWGFQDRRAEFRSVCRSAVVTPFEGVKTAPTVASRRC